MLSSFSYLLAAFAVATRVSAVPTGFTGSGAAYFITNDPSGNQILSMSIASNGTLSGITATDTGGIGAHGVSTPITADGLFSQGSITVNAAMKILIAVNPGSNTLSMFKFHSAYPTKLKMVGKPVSSGGEFPISAAINDQGSMVCVLNGGAVNGVNCYTPDLKSGLIPIPNTLRYLGVNQTTPATGPIGSLSQVLFIEDGQTLIASVKGVPPTPGFLAAWAIAPDGSLSAEAMKSEGGALPFGMAVIPGTNALVISDAGFGFDVFNFGQEENSLMATFSSVRIPGQHATCWSSFSPSSGNFYLTDANTSIITEVNVDENFNGTIVKQYPQNTLSQTIDSNIATIGNNSFLYVLAPIISTVDVLNVNVAGQAETVQNFNFSSAAQEAGVTLNGFNLQGMTTFII